MLLRRLGMRGAWLGAALFAVHPLQVQTVAWISQQSHLLCAALCMGSAWAFLRLNRIRPPMAADELPSDVTHVDQLMDPEPVGLLYGLSIGLAIAAMLSDTIAVGLPLALLVLLWWKRGTVSWGIWLQLIPFFVISAVGMTVAIKMGIGTPEAGGIAPALSLLQRSLVASRAIWAYALGIVWPYPLLFVYPRWSVSTADWLSFLFPIGVIGVITLAWAGKRFWGRGPLAAILLFLILLFPAIWLVLGFAAPPIFIADHLQYLAAAAPLAVAAWALVGPISLVSSPILIRSIRVAVAVAVLTPLGVMVWLQTQDYSDQKLVWKSTLAQDPSVTVARVQLAVSLMRSGKPLEAADLLRAAPPGPRDAAMLQAWGQVYAAQNRFPEAVDSFHEARKLEPENRDLTYELAGALARAGRIDEAIATYRNELKRDPNNDVIYNSMGLIFAAQGKREQAIEMYQKALTVNPRSIYAKINYASVLFQTGRPSEAAKQLQEVVAIDPSDFETFVVAAVMQIQIRDFAGAEENCRLALSRNSKSADAWNTLGVAQCHLGRVREAIISFEQAIEHRPDYEEAKKNLEVARRSLVS
jgi:tetratricopeptide (TPR) repeat protein